MKKPFCPTTRLIIEKETNYQTDDLAILHNYCFQPNLTNEGFKEREGDPPYLRRVECGTRIL